MSSFPRLLLTTAGAAAIAFGSASAQLLPPIGVPGVGSLPGGALPGGALPDIGRVLDNVLGRQGAAEAVSPTLDSIGLPERIAELPSGDLLDLRKLRLRQLIREYPRDLEMDGEGSPVRRAALIAIDPRPADLAAARRAGFTVVRDETSASLGLRGVVLAIPRGTNTRDALKRLRKAAPGIEVDYDHLFEPAGGALAASAAAVAVNTSARGAVIAMIDGGVASHPALAGTAIEQRGFAGAAQSTGHGTAVASLIVGNQGAFRGAAPGASLLVADVYGGSRAAGSASSIFRALGWVAAKRPKVVNISLVGPGNRLLERAIGALRARGIAVVAAVGNDGPAAPPQYPASYPGVIAVTAVDARDRALAEAGRARHLDFAAPGADLAAALPGRGYARVRGTSFAAPLVAARLALTGSPAQLAAEAVPGKGRVGRGILCKPCRIEPRAVGAK